MIYLNKKNIKASLVFNLIIAVLTIFASIIMFTGFKFMHGPEILLETTKLGMFKFFTVQSNIFMGIISLLFVVKELKIINKEDIELTILDYILKLMSTTSVGLTFFVVFAYLGPISKDGIASMLMNSNLFFHLIIPVLSIITFIFFEKSDKISFKNTFFGIVPTVLYGIYYISNILLHMESGKVDFKYDWYWFVQNGVCTALIVMPIVLIIAYLISVTLWRLNKVKVKE